VLVLGASGGVGLASIQVARALGASVVGVCSARNVALVERLGAKAIDYGQGNALEAARAHGPFDVIVHAVGTDVYPLGTCRSLLTDSGKVTLVVVRPADYPCFAVLPSVHSVLGRPTRPVLAQLAKWVAEGRFECLIESTRSLDEAEEALQVSKKGKVVGKLLLKP
jgi:NADPH:quinone reductase-like Zn-dependent oxidoreductase